MAKEKLVLRALRVKVVLLVRMVLLVQWVPVVFLVREAALGPLVLLELVVMMVFPVLLAHLDPSALLVLLVSPVLQALRVKQAQLVHVDLRVPKVQEANPELQGLPDLQGLLAILVLMVSLELKVQLVLLVLLALLDSLAHVVHPDLKVLLAPSVPKVKRVIQVLQVSRVSKDLRVKSDPQVLRVPLDQPARKAREVPVVNLVQLGHLDPMVNEELPVTVVSQVKMVFQVPRVPLASAAWPALGVLREQMVILAALENLDFLVQEDLPVALVMLDLKEKLAPLVLLVKTVVQALLVHRVLVDSLV